MCTHGFHYSPAPVKVEKTNSSIYNINKIIVYVILLTYNKHIHECFPTICVYIHKSFLLQCNLYRVGIFSFSALMGQFSMLWIVTWYVYVLINHWDIQSLIWEYSDLITIDISRCPKSYFFTPLHMQDYNCTNPCCDIFAHT